MSWRSPGKHVLATLLTIALVSACDATLPAPTPSVVAVLAGSPSASASASAGTSAAPSPSAGVVVPLALWTDCGKGLTCADVRVPRDYDALSKGYLDIRLLRLASTDPKGRVGSLLVNPGGPGASGIDFVRQASEAKIIPAALRKKFDIVGFDPRGVNQSSAIRCIDNLDAQAKLDPSPDDDKEFQQLVDAARAYAGECAKRNDTTLPYLSTNAVAQDLDLIRQAVGDQKLTYLGFSYGTLIGSLYADRFPDRIRAMVLDGAIDPSLDLEQLRFGQAGAFEKALTSFLDDCAARTDCAFHEKGRSKKAFDALMASIDTTSLPAPLLHTRRRVGPAIASFAVLAALYAKESWPVLATSLEFAKHGDGSLLLAIADPYRGRKPNGSYSNQQDAYTANTCLDFPAPTDVATYRSWATKLRASAPHFAGLMAYNDLPCAFWPTPAQRTPGPVRAAGAPAIVIVGTTGDPATPYGWAKALARELESAVLVTHKGEGHTAYLTDTCVQKAVNAYLLDLTVPKTGLTCD